MKKFLTFFLLLLTFSCASLDPHTRGITRVVGDLIGLYLLRHRGYLELYQAESWRQELKESFEKLRKQYKLSPKECELVEKGVSDVLVELAFLGQEEEREEVSELKEKP